MSPWLKAGIVGAAIVVVLNVLGVIPCLGLVTCCMGLVVYAGVGALAAHWIPPVREPGSAAVQGALAALLASLAGGIALTVVLVVQMALLGGAQLLSQFPPEMLQQLYDAGIDPELFVGPTGGAISGSMCCVGGLFLAAILGAIGGAIYAGIKPD